MDRQTDRLPHLTSLLFHSSTNMVRTSCHISVHNIFSSYYSLLHLVSSLYPLPLALSPPRSLSGHYEVEIKAPSEPPRRMHIASVSEAKYIKRQTDRDKQCPVSSKIAFPSNLPSVLCSSLLHLSTVSNVIQLPKVCSITENSVASVFQGENGQNGQSTINVYDYDSGCWCRKWWTA